MAGFTILMLSLINISCNKEPGDGRAATVPWTPTPPTPLPPPPQPPPPSPGSSNQNMWVDANMNITIELPMNFAVLNGEATREAKVKWEKISGPASYLLENPDASKTKVTNLEKGVYKFKLSVTSNSGQTGSDTMTLIVQDATSTKKQINGNKEGNFRKANFFL